MLSSHSRRPARLVALDWGTTNLRAKLLGDEGRILDSRVATCGVMAVPEGGFETALMSLCADWISEQRLPIIASGMVGSRQGWREAPYLSCPATPGQAARQLVAVPLSAGACLHIIPGLRCEDEARQPDVMRGEETQCWGADLPAGSCALLPGTHSKWVWMGSGGAIERFQTHMTGELYAVLRQHSILGRLMEPGVPQPQAFSAGVELGLREFGRLLHQLFAVRTSGLFGHWAPHELPDFLSGLLIGAEIGSIGQRGAPAGVTLIGSAELTSRYQTALRLAGMGSTEAPFDATTRGQWQLALAAGIVKGP